MTLTNAIWALSQVRRGEDTRVQLQGFIARSGRCSAYSCNSCLFKAVRGPCLTYGWSTRDIVWASSILLRRLDA